jgi:hypothetical protein
MKQWIGVCAVAITTVHCGDPEDHGRPVIISVGYRAPDADEEKDTPLQMTDLTSVALADILVPIEGKPLAVFKQGTLKVTFSELLKGSLLEELHRDPVTHAVLSITPRPGVVALRDAGHTDVAVSFQYILDERSLHITTLDTDADEDTDPDALAPGNYVLYVLADKIQDNAGNAIEPAKDATGEVVHLSTGEAVVAAIPFTTVTQ